MSTNLVQLLRDLFFDPVETQKYLDNPTQYLRDAGMSDESYEEINEAAILACSEPVSQGAVVTTGGASVGSSGAAGVGSSVGSVGSSHTGTVGGSGGMTPPAAQPAPPPPPPPPADMPPQEALEQVVHYYVTNVSDVTNVTNVTETTNVDDRDTHVDSSVNQNILATDNARIDLDVENTTTTASGDRAVAAGDDVSGVATGDGAIAAGDDLRNANSGTNNGIIGDDNDVDDSVFGGENVNQINDSEGVAFGDGSTAITDSENVATGDGNTFVGDTNGNLAFGDGNVQADKGSQAAGGDLRDDDTTQTVGNHAGDVTFADDGSTIDQSIADSGNTTVEGSFNEDNDVSDAFKADGSFNEDNDGVDDSLQAQDSFQTAENSFNDESIVDAPVETDDGTVDITI